MEHYFPTSKIHNRTMSNPSPPPQLEQQHQLQQPQPTKRTRVLLSCAPCRTSKLKCDRQQPCGQCVKKVRADGCTYAPRPEKSKPARSMAARLKRLEGMVRGMMNVDGVPIPEKPWPPTGTGPDGQSPSRPRDSTCPNQAQAQIVLGRSTTYVGATHFMAMLDDIEDLKSYFDEEEEESLGGKRYQDVPEPSSSDTLLISSGLPTSRQELLDVLPPRQVVDRLVQRYFSAHSPSMSVTHRPQFAKQYAEFWANPDGASLDWLAFLYLILALGVFFSTFMAPHELEADGDLPAMGRFKRYRAAAGWALVTGKYTSPATTTLAPFLLYVEAEFLTNRASQMNCYLLTAVCIRMMLRMGLHRDPSKLAHIPPFDGEMRRRLWHLATQFELMVSFHLGLPSMIPSIESDTALPRNLVDEDISVDCTELPPSRPDSEYTLQSYPRSKSALCQVFGLIARQVNALTPPPYVEIMKYDSLLEVKWSQVPIFMKLRPLEDSIADSLAVVNQRFGLASLYQKSRVVLHRRYIIEAVPRPEHAYSRRVCLEAAMALLDHQNAIHVAALPGGILRMNGWFVMSLAIHDFLLAAMVIYLVLQNETYDMVAGEWTEKTAPLPGRDHLYNLLAQSHRIWIAVFQDAPVFKKAADILKTMLRKLNGTTTPRRSSSNGPQTVVSWRQTSTGLEAVSVGGLSIDENEPWYSGSSSPVIAEQQQELLRVGLLPQNSTAPVNGLDAGTWLGTSLHGMDWTTFDSAIQGENQAINETAAGGWNPQPGADPLIHNFQYLGMQPPGQGQWN